MYGRRHVDKPPRASRVLEDKRRKDVCELRLYILSIMVVDSISRDQDEFEARRAARKLARRLELVMSGTLPQQARPRFHPKII